MPQSRAIIIALLLLPLLPAGLLPGYYAIRWLPAPLLLRRFRHIIFAYINTPHITPLLLPLPRRHM